MSKTRSTMGPTYRYVNDHGDVYRMTEQRYARYLLAGTTDPERGCVSEWPDAAKFGVLVGTAVTVNSFTPQDFLDEFNRLYAPQAVARAALILSVKCPTCEAEIGAHCQRTGKRFEAVYYKGNGAVVRDSQRKIPHDARARAAQRHAGMP